MPRSVKHGGKRKHRYVKNKNAVTSKKKALKRKKSKLFCKELATEWNKSKTVKQNLESMGLVYNINKALKLLPVQDNSANHELEEMDIEEVGKVGSISEQRNKNEQPPLTEKAKRVISALEKTAVEDEARMRSGRKFRLLQKDIDFCVYMMKRYDEDYEAMSRDAKNIYQNTPQQIQRKLRIFKHSPEFGTYFKAA